MISWSRNLNDRNPELVVGVLVMALLMTHLVPNPDQNDDLCALYSPKSYCPHQNSNLLIISSLRSRSRSFLLFVASFLERRLVLAIETRVLIYFWPFLYYSSFVNVLDSALDALQPHYRCTKSPPKLFCRGMGTRERYQRGFQSHCVRIV